MRASRRVQNYENGSKCGQQCFSAEEEKERKWRKTNRENFENNI